MKIADPVAAIATSSLEGGKKTTGHLQEGYGAECGKCGARRIDRQLGLEPTPEEYVANMVEVFREVRRVLRADGTCWLNLGDSYNAHPGGNGDRGGRSLNAPQGTGEQPQYVKGHGLSRAKTLKPKDLVGIPWLVARALQEPYYTGRVRSEKERVWLAATLDGEGTICGFRHERKDDGRTRTGAHIFITNSATRMLDEAERIWPASRSEHARPGEGHLGELPTYRWIVHGIENKIAFLREVYPHLIVKRAQAVLAYNLLLLMRDAKRLARTPQHARILEKRDVLVKMLSEANHRLIDVPTWCEEPPSLYEPGWYLRSDIIWSKPNPMPESVTDRPTKAHEYLFLLTKSPRYFFDQEAVREANVTPEELRRDRFTQYDGNRPDGWMPTGLLAAETRHNPAGRNIRSVWEIATQAYPEAHFATFPQALVEPCIKAGCPEGGTVCDPFLGSGTTALVARRLGRKCIGIELNPAYAELAAKRLQQLSLLA